MPWYAYLAWFFAGVFLTNSIPHTVQGLSGNRFQSPFGSPPGVGKSSAQVNVIWGLANFAVGGALLHVFFPSQMPPPWPLCIAGTAWSSGRWRGGDPLISARCAMMPPHRKRSTTNSSPTSGTSSCDLHREPDQSEPSGLAVPCHGRLSRPAKCCSRLIVYRLAWVELEALQARQRCRAARTSATMARQQRRRRENAGLGAEGHAGSIA